MGPVEMELLVAGVTSLNRDGSQAPPFSLSQWAFFVPLRSLSLCFEQSQLLIDYLYS